MSADYLQARSQMNKLFFDAWKSGSSEIVGYVPNVEWQGLYPISKPENDKFWCRVSIQTIDESQTTLQNNCRRYTALGLFFVQIFGPVCKPDSFKKTAMLAKLAKNAFQGKTTSGGLWFRNARINELEPEEVWQRINVIVGFQYDEVLKGN